MEPMKEEDKMEKKKITQLLLNTPGACFLCLKDNQTDDGELNGGIVDLGRICRYLNIDQSSLLLTSLKNDGGAGVEQGQCAAFSVNLCQKCQELTEKLNNGIIQLERAKLMVNFHLNSFHKRLEGGNEGEGDWEGSLEWINLLGRMHANPNNSFEAKLVQLLREEAKDKSLKILKKAEAAKPQVILPKLTPPPPGILPSFNTSIKSSRDPSIKNLLNHLLTSNVIPSKKARKSKLYRCPYCPKILTRTRFPIHLSCDHSDKLLSSIFPSGSTSTSPPSESLCRQVLQTKVVDMAVKIQSSSSSSASASPRLGCHLCGITYSGAPLLKQHFLISHTDNLCQEINKFVQNSQKFKNSNLPASLPSSSQNAPVNSVEELIENLLQTCSINNDNNLSGSKVTKTCQCPFCGISFGFTKFKFVRHLANLHSDKLLAPFTTTNVELDKLRNDNPNHFSQLCRKVMAAQVTKALKFTGATGVTLKLGCHLCGITYSDNRQLKHHLLVNHTEYLIDELIKMQHLKIGGGQDKLKKKKKKKVIKKVTPTTTQPLESQPKRRRFGEKKGCEICGITLVDNTKLRRHHVTQHSDQLFLKCKPGEMGGGEWREICKGFFGGEVKQATYGRPGGKIYKCGYCPIGGGGGGEVSYKWSDDFMMHLGYQHGGEMEEKLGIYCGGDLEEEGDGREVDVEVKLDVGDGEGINLEEFEKEYGLFEGEEDGGVFGGGGDDKQKEKRRVGGFGRVKDKRCGICGLAFFQENKLRRHLASQHPEQLFLGIKPSWIGEETLRGNCKEVFGREVREATGSGGGKGEGGGKVYRCRYCARGKTSYKGGQDLVVHLAYQHRREMEGRLEEFEKSKNSYGDGGDLEVDMEEEDDGGSLHQMLYPDMVLDELNDKHGGEGYQQTDYLQQFGYLEGNDDGGDEEVDNNLLMGRDGTDAEEQFVGLADNNQLESEPVVVPVEPIVKMEVNQDISLDDIY